MHWLKQFLHKSAGGVFCYLGLLPVSTARHRQSGSLLQCLALEQRREPTGHLSRQRDNHLRVLLMTSFANNAYSQDKYQYKLHKWLIQPVEWPSSLSTTFFSVNIWISFVNPSLVDFCCFYQIIKKCILFLFYFITLIYVILLVLFCFLCSTLILCGLFVLSK